MGKGANGCNEGCDKEIRFLFGRAPAKLQEGEVGLFAAIFFTPY